MKAVVKTSKIVSLSVETCGFRVVYSVKQDQKGKTHLFNCFETKFDFKATANCAKGIAPAVK